MSRGAGWCRRSLVPDLYRHLAWTGARVASRRPGIARPRGGPGAALDVTAGERRAALPSVRRVVALREVDEMPHPGHLGDLPAPARGNLVGPIGGIRPVVNSVDV